MRYLTSKELFTRSKIQINDILNYNNLNYIVKDGMQNCKICPFKKHCYDIDCHGGFDLEFQPISEIELLILREEGKRR